MKNILASIVVVLPDTKVMCMIRNPTTLKEKARFNTKEKKSLSMRNIVSPFGPFPIIEDGKSTKKEDLTKCDKSGCKISCRSRKLSIPKNNKKPAQEQECHKSGRKKCIKLHLEEGIQDIRALKQKDKKYKI